VTTGISYGQHSDVLVTYKLKLCFLESSTERKKWTYFTVHLWVSEICHV